ncbi:hypothetical protein llap_1267 [Limosa lapponica baueri]|uniref:Uncharacterized protein n=1 Tax=Limosa lapponica baueri TaxID=1758121 RepID=A0A2I0UQW6_LIMLA|nr:hypothetical protein llap_1267 [Limosa lapponica baueri]
MGGREDHPQVPPSLLVYYYGVYPFSVRHRSEGVQEERQRSMLQLLLRPSDDHSSFIGDRPSSRSTVFLIAVRGLEVAVFSQVFSREQNPLQVFK